MSVGCCRDATSKLNRVTDQEKVRKSRANDKQPEKYSERSTGMGHRKVRVGGAPPRYLNGKRPGRRSLKGADGTLPTCNGHFFCNAGPMKTRQLSFHFVSWYGGHVSRNKGCWLAQAATSVNIAPPGQIIAIHVGYHSV